MDIKKMRRVVLQGGEQSADEVIYQLMVASPQPVQVAVVLPPREGEKNG